MLSTNQAILFVCRHISETADQPDHVCHRTEQDIFERRNI